MKSTKLDTAARLCQYFLSQDDLPIPTFEGGSLKLPPIPPPNGTKATAKMVLFSEFPSMISLIENVSLSILELNAGSNSTHILGLQPLRR